MRAFLLAAVIGLGAGSAFAGPSDHGGVRGGESTRIDRRANRTRPAAYALTGERPQRRVLQFRDVPQGRGETHRLPFWVWVDE